MGPSRYSSYSEIISQVNHLDMWMQPKVILAIVPVTLRIGLPWATTKDLFSKVRQTVGSIVIWPTSKKELNKKV